MWYIGSSSDVLLLIRQGTCDISEVLATCCCWYGKEHVAYRKFQRRAVVDTARNVWHIGSSSDVLLLIRQGTCDISEVLATCCCWYGKEHVAYRKFQRRAVIDTARNIWYIGSSSDVLLLIRQGTCGISEVLATCSYRYGKEHLV